MPPKKKSGSHFSSAKIKRMMQSNEDIPKIANSVPVLIAKALDMMTRDLLECCTEGFSVKMLTGPHVKHCVESYSKFGFAEKFVANVQSLAYDNGKMDANKSKKSSVMRKVPTVSKKTTANEPESSKKRKRLPVQQPSHVQQQKPKKRGRPRKEKVSPTYDDEIETDDISMDNNKPMEIFAVPTTKFNIQNNTKDNSGNLHLSLNQKVTEDDDYDAEEEPLQMVFTGLASNTAYDEDDDYDS